MSAAAGTGTTNNPNIVGNNTFLNLNAILEEMSPAENNFSHLAHLTRNRPRPGNRTFKGNRGPRARFGNVTVYNRPRSENNNARRRHMNVIMKQQMYRKPSYIERAILAPQHSAENAHAVAKVVAKNAGNIALGPSWLSEQKARQAAVEKKLAEIPGVGGNPEIIDTLIDPGFEQPRSLSESGPRRKTTPSATLIFRDGHAEIIDVPITAKNVRNAMNASEEAERMAARANYKLLNNVGNGSSRRRRNRRSRRN